MANRAGNTFITSIPIGQIEAGMAQHFNGQYNSYVHNWSATSREMTGVRLELRWYPDDADSLDASDGYKVLDRISIVTWDTVWGNINLPVKCNSGGWLAVYGIGMYDNEIVAVTIQGYDSKN